MPDVLILECRQEISSFNPVASTYADFDIQRAGSMADQAGSNTAVGGALAEFASRRGIVAQCVFSAIAGSGGPLSAAGWQQLSTEILEAIAAVEGPVDGLFFSMHGAMGAEDELDPEGALLEGARRILGSNVPIVISLDLHGILTKRMLSNVNGLAVYHTYPHVDFADTGARAARILIDILHGNVSPVIARAPIPALVRGDELLTSTGYFGELIRDVQMLERKGVALAAGILIGNPFTDVPELCSQIVVTTDNNVEIAEREVKRLARLFWQQRSRMQAKLFSLDMAVEEARTINGPVIFTDAADATSSGASGDSAEILIALLNAGYQGRILAPLVDRAAAEAAHKAGMGAKISVTLGGSLDRRFGSVQLSARVTALSDGQAVLETSGLPLDAGPSAAIVSGNLTVVVLSRSVSLFDRAMFLAHGCDPKSFDLIIVKSPYCEYHMFDEWSERNFNIDAPGSTSANLPVLGHRNCRRPTYPIDQDFEFVTAPEIYMAGGQKARRQMDSNTGMPVERGT